MTGGANNVLSNPHFRKMHGGSYRGQKRYHIKARFDSQAMKTRRRMKRSEKALKNWPRPAFKLRPIVQCFPLRHNTRCRRGAGFTLMELRAAWKELGGGGLGTTVCKEKAAQLGIAFDHRRKNRSQEHLQRNVNRLKEYLGRLELCEHFGKKKKEKGRKAWTTDAIKEAMAGQSQILHKDVIPFDRYPDRKIGVEAKPTGTKSAHTQLRLARGFLKHVGKDKKKKEEK
eukprot:NODE_19607_length_835_cov_8.786723.p1 GENE.NODE_19607_length_835_cov_8.786723~~NODE_19607_length_835_cov_8.786723.p1  ORF type:complete len:228 (-),score=60.22 NODE_19607_length_835_cov_8.786723:104-787(-)